MKINYKERKTIAFKNLRPKEVCNLNGIICIKIKTIEESNGDKINAIDLEWNQPFYANENDMVELLDYDFIINN